MWLLQLVDVCTGPVKRQRENRHALHGLMSFYLLLLENCCRWVVHPVVCFLFVPH